MPASPPCPVVAVIGAGFCGATLALQLARAGGVAVLLIDRSGRFGPGLAYGAARPIHLLNTPAGRMSAFTDDPEHFVRWARAQGLAVTGASFLPRPVYGEYIARLLADCPRGQPGLTCLTGQVVELAREGDGLALALADGGRLRVDHVALCPGNPPPAAIPGLPAALRDDPRHVADPWTLGPTRLDADAPVLLLGSGLTALDVALTLTEAGHRGPIHAVSRRGRLPQPHRPAARPGTYPTPAVERWPATARGQLAALRAEVRAAQAQGHDWREVVASLRAVTPNLWRALPLAEQDRFVRHLRPFWDSHRHRAAPETHRAIARLQAEGRFHVHAARLAEVEAADGGLRVTLVHGAERRALEVGALINCTGPASDLRRCDDPLLRALLARGLATIDDLALGLAATADGRLIGVTGPAANLWLAGPLRRGADWEATAVLELAAQVEALAAAIVAELGGGCTTCPSGQPRRLPGAREIG